MMPDGLTPFKQKLIAASGFGNEFLFAVVFYLLGVSFAIYYVIISVIHFVAYFFYAGDASDFQWFRK